MDMKDFLNVLASKEPVPGGGGACGYVAAVGMALMFFLYALWTLVLFFKRNFKHYGNS